MTPSDKTRFSEIMMGMADNFRDSITKPGMRMRFDMLKDFTIEQVEKAARSIMARRKYTKMPPVAEFIEEIGGCAPSIEDEAVVQADMIIGKSFEFVDGKPVFEDEITRYLMSKVWPYHSWSTTVLTSELKWWKKDFIQSYVARRNTTSQPQIECRKTSERISQITKGMIGSI